MHDPIDYAGNAPKITPRDADIWWVGRRWLVSSDGLESIDGRHSVSPREIQRALLGGTGLPFSMEAEDADDLATAVLACIAMHGLTIAKAQVFELLGHAAKRRARGRF